MGSHPLAKINVATAGAIQAQAFILEAGAKHFVVVVAKASCVPSSRASGAFVLVGKPEAVGAHAELVDLAPYLPGGEAVALGHAAKGTGPLRLRVGRGKTATIDKVGSAKKLGPTSASEQLRAFEGAGPRAPKASAPIADWNVFHQAPVDQRTSWFHGDERIDVDGLPQPFGGVLPKLGFLARLAIDDSDPLELAMAIDTLRIDIDHARLDVLARAHWELPAGRVKKLMLRVGLGSSGHPIVWPEDLDMAMPSLAPHRLAHTLVLDAAGQTPASLPFGGQGKRAKASQTAGSAAWARPEKAPEKAPSPASRARTTPPRAPLSEAPPRSRRPKAKPAPAEPSVAVAAPSPAQAAFERAVVPIGDATRPVAAIDAVAAVALRVPTGIRKSRWIVIVKASFDLVEGGAARVREEAQPLSGEVPSGDDMSSSPRCADDFVPTKSKADVLLVGKAHAPGGSAKRMQVSFAFGHRGSGFSRSIAVHGPRQLVRTPAGELPGEPAFFESAPLTYELAFGGQGHEENPVGKGFGNAHVPELEDPSNLIVSRSSRPAPVGFGPISRFWPQRLAKMGKVESDYVDKRWPLPPASFDVDYYASAPLAQRLPTIDGNEPFTIIGMTSDVPKLDGRLGKKTMVAGVLDDRGTIKKLDGRIDTVTFDPDDRRVDLVWRGSIDAAALGRAPVFAAALVDIGADDAERARKLDLALAAALPVVATLEVASAQNEANDEAVMERYVARARERLLRAGVLSAADVPAPAQAISTVAPPPEDIARDPEKRAGCEAKLAAREGVAGSDLAEADLRGLDLRGISLVDADLRGADLRGMHFDGGDLTGAQLGGALCEGAVFDGAKLDGADFTGAKLDRARFVGCSLVRACFDEAVMKEAVFDGANATDAKFERSTLTGASFEKADLTKAVLSRAKLDGARFPNAKLQDASLYEVDGKGASFEKAQAKGLRANDARLVQANLEAIDAPDAVFDGADLSRAEASGATMTGASFVEARLASLVAPGAKLEGARMIGADLREATLAGANLAGASFEAADLTDADARKANLHGVEFLGATLLRWRRDGAITTSTKLGGS